MLADPRRMEAHLFGVNRLVEDVGDERVRVALVVVVVVVAERKIAEFHFPLLLRRIPAGSAACNARQLHHEVGRRKADL